MSEVDDGPPMVAPALPPMRPITDPRVLRDRTVADYMRNMGAPGMPATPDGIEALAVADLNLSDAFRRDEPAPLPRKPMDPAEAQARADEAVAAKVRETGAEVTRAPRDLGPQFDLPPEYGASERWQAAKYRLAMIMRGASPPIRRPDGSFDFRSMTATCEAPALAYKFLCHWFDHDLRYVAQTQRHNPYFGLSNRDASLKLARLVEDLCDQSTGIPGLGAWRVEK